MTKYIELMPDFMDRTFQDFERAIPSKPKSVKLSFGSVSFPKGNKSPDEGLKLAFLGKPLSLEFTPCGGLYLW